FLQIVSLGDGKLIGRYVKEGFPVADIADVSRNVRSIVRLITRGHAVGEDSVHIYAISCPLCTASNYSFREEGKLLEVIGNDESRKMLGFVATDVHVQLFESLPIIEGDDLVALPESRERCVHCLSRTLSFEQ